MTAARWRTTTGTRVAHAVWLERDTETLTFCLEVLAGRLRSRQSCDVVCGECWLAVGDHAAVAL